MTLDDLAALFAALRETGVRAVTFHLDGGMVSPSVVAPSAPSPAPTVSPLEVPPSPPREEPADEVDPDRYGSAGYEPAPPRRRSA